MKMEYIYAAMLLHKAGKAIDEDSLKKVVAAAGIQVDDAKVKTVVAALNGVDIEKAIKEAAPVAVAAAPAASSGGKKEEKPKEEEKVSEEAAAAGLGALFG
jgi:large subunit ribosomal protein L12